MMGQEGILPSGQNPGYRLDTKGLPVSGGSFFAIVILIDEGGFHGKR